MSRWLLTAAVLALPGCSSSYSLRGRAVDAGFGDITIVDRENRLVEEGRGVAGALVRIYRDPNRLDRSLAASGRSDIDGRVDIEIEAFGAGWMDEVWLIEVTREGFESVEGQLRLPSNRSDRQLLITMRPGRSTPPATVDPLWDQYERHR